MALRECAGRYLAAINGCSIFDLHQRQQILLQKNQIVNQELETL